MLTKITELPAAPKRTDAPADFVQKADAHVASLPQFVAELNTVSGEIETTVESISTIKNETSGLVDDARQSADEAALSAEASAANANFKGEWSQLTGALTVPSTVYYANQFWHLINNVNDVTTEQPGSSSAWVQSANPVPIVPQTGGGVLTVLRVNEIRDGETYQLPPAASVLENDWIEVTLPLRYSVSTPTVQVNEGDQIIFDQGTDTDILFNGGAANIRLTSDGISAWSL